MSDKNPTLKNTLVLHITVPGFNAEDFDQVMRLMIGPEWTPEDAALVVTEEWMKPEVGLTLWSQPGMGDQNHDFSSFLFNGRVVGAAVIADE